MEKISSATDRVARLAQLCSENGLIAPELFTKFDVKRGLRDLNGKGVLTGLTNISAIKSFELVDGTEMPCNGELRYRGIDIKELVDGFMSDNRFGFEEIVYLLLFGRQPTWAQLDEFTTLLSEYRELPNGFVRDIIMKAPSTDMMNTLSRSVLTLYAYDNKADDTSIENVLSQLLRLIAQFPLLSVYGYNAYLHYHNSNSLHIHHAQPGLSTAENILHLLRPDSKYTEFEAKILDLALILHAEHGGGNNSTFTTRVITSSGTDTYSAIAGALGSLKGPRHGGANIKVVEMVEQMKKDISDWTDDEAIRDYLFRMLNKDAFDKSGLIYGMGHAVYSLSDPRAEIFKQFVKQLSEEKGRREEFEFYSKIETIAPQVIAEKRKIYKGVSANVDFYSGFVYNMLDLPTKLFTPIFAIARITGWAAHRLEEIVCNSKIIRPSYKNVLPFQPYVHIDDRA